MGSSPEDDGIIGGRFMQPLVTPDCTSALHRAALGTYFILVPCFGIKEWKGSSVCARKSMSYTAALCRPALTGATVLVQDLL